MWFMLALQDNAVDPGSSSSSDNNADVLEPQRPAVEVSHTDTTDTSSNTDTVKLVHTELVSAYAADKLSFHINGAFDML